MFHLRKPLSINGVFSLTVSHCCSLLGAFGPPPQAPSIVPRGSPPACRRRFGRGTTNSSVSRRTAASALMSEWPRSLCNATRVAARAESQSRGERRAAVRCDEKSSRPDRSFYAAVLKVTALFKPNGTSFPTRPVRSLS
jgi:hypothetical protein